MKIRSRKAQGGMARDDSCNDSDGDSDRVMLSAVSYKQVKIRAMLLN